MNAWQLVGSATFFGAMVQPILDPSLKSWGTGKRVVCGVAWGSAWLLFIFALYGIVEAT